MDVYVYYCIQNFYINCYDQEVQCQGWFVVLVVNQVDSDEGCQYVSQINNNGVLYLFCGICVFCQFEDFWCVIYDDVYFGKLLYDL